MPVSSPPSRRVLVLGASGVIGKVLMNALLDCKHDFERIGMFTSADTVAAKKDLVDSFRNRGVDIVTGSLDSQEDVLAAFQDYDTVVSALGRFAIDKQVGLIALAVRSPSIVRFFPSEYGTDVAYNASSAAERPHQKKLKVRACLESGAAVQRLKYTYLVTGPFADLYMGCMSSEPQMGSFDVAALTATLLGSGNESVSLTTMADVGRSLVAALRHPEVCDNKAVRVHSFTTTPHAILAEFERQTDSRWTVNYTSLAALKRLEDAAWAGGHPLASICTLRRIWTEGGTLYEHTDNEAIGMAKMDTLEMAVQDAVASPAAAFQSGQL